ncbi:MAG TPA: HAMP domain-containing sensor histidine kinase [Caulobacteraceae bacterium]|jgi:signal transduction histidine kinase
MRVSDLWRTTTFRLTALYGLLFALATIVMLAVIYLQSTRYLTSRVDRILVTHADALERSPPGELRERIHDALALNDDRTNIFAVFSRSGGAITGNLAVLPRGLTPGGAPVETPPTKAFPAYARLIARRLPTGEELVVGRDVNQLRRMRSILGSALSWSGAALVLVGLGFGTALSINPLRRLQLLQAAAHDIAGGDLKRRIPASARRDELDMFADTVNHMVGEVERLMSEVKASTDTIAHDLRTPLTRARARLHRLQQDREWTQEDIGRVITEVDEVLDRFRAILRLSELEARDRRAGFERVDLSSVVAEVADLYAPLAEAGGVRLSVQALGEAIVQADPKLLFEAVSNLVDNAIKFSPQGGFVRLRLNAVNKGACIVVEDEGPGIAPNERQAVLQRFYRGERTRLAPGSGLGLSVVAAIVRLHGFELTLEDAGPGLRVKIDCKPALPA